ncbi:MAG: glycosyltransferase [Chloroflexi bacterium]|nr:glycosyltransferase [Chloroflexota bacterium]
MEYASLLVVAGLAAGIVAVQWSRWSRDRLLVPPARHVAAALPPHPPKVSVLVAAWNEAALLPSHIESFKRLRYPNRELVLCAGGTDGTVELAASSRSECVVVLEQQPGEGKQRALRKAYEHATGDLFYLTDADCELDDESFEATLAPLLNDAAQAATGGSRPLDRQMSTPFVVQQWYVDRYVRAHWGPSTDGILGRNAAFMRDAVEASGGFRYEAPTGTDYVMAKRLREAGVTILHAPASQIASEYAADFGTYRRQQSRWLRNVVLHGVRFGVYGEAARGLAPSILGMLMIVGTPVAVLIGPLPAALTAAAWLFVILNRARYVRAGERLTGTSFGAGYWQIPWFVLIDFVVWALVLLDYPFKAIRTRW